jgi:hypothetical protein
MMNTFTGKIGNQDEWNKNSLSASDVACFSEK